MSGQWVSATVGGPDNKTSWVRPVETYAGVGSSWELVNQRFDTTAEFSQTAFSIAKSYIDRLEGLIKELEAYQVPEIEVDRPDIDYPNTRPVKKFGDSGLHQIVWPTNTATTPHLSPLPPITGVDTDLPQLISPTYTDIASPTIGDIASPVTPVISRQPIPAEPEYPNPVAPVISDLVVREIPKLHIPGFEDTLEIIEENLAVPDSFNWEASPYNSEIWDTFLQKVLKGLNDGGTGLSPEVEQAIYDRAIYRQQLENDKAVRTTENYFSAKGFTLPPGAVARRVQEISIEVLRANTDLNEKIAISQAELAQKNEHFYLEMARQGEIILREFFSSQENRLLEAAKVTVSLGIEVFKSYLSKQGLKLEIYRTQLAVYVEKIKAVLAEVELYKAEVEAVVASSNVQRTQVELYTAQVGALEVLGKFYNTRLQAVEVAQRIENTKIELFKVETEVYSAKLAAEKNKVDIFSALNEAERTKAITFGEKVKARISELEVKKLQFDFQVQQLNAVVQSNTAELERYKSELSAFNTQVDSKAKEVGANVEAYKAEISAYIAENSAHDSYFSAKLKEADLALQEAKLNLDLQVATINTRNDAYVAIKKLQLGGTEGIMNVSSQLTASALTAVNASASYGYTGSEGFGHQINYSAQISENHSIPHDPPQ